ncbi:FG-GAP repeat domain-containing protein [Streptomyces sp. NBC_00273]|uniref:FG-GAP repeat domain-containing protein n=1 Tax=Streptomyces sp. NBC_00273 TaxID=2903644 RepID=UPI002E2A0317|nr:VCBS repeat-containing protein [Streptomyces sp. NBC_00273]
MSSAVSLALAGGLAATGVVAGTATTAVAAPAVSAAGRGSPAVGAQAWPRVSKKNPNRSYSEHRRRPARGQRGRRRGPVPRLPPPGHHRAGGATVSKATLRITNTGAASCTGRPVELWSVGAVSANAGGHRGAGASFARGTRIATSGDWTGGGYNDLLVLEPRAGLQRKLLRRVPGNGPGGVRPSGTIVSDVSRPVADPDAGCVNDAPAWTGDNRSSHAEDVAGSGDVNGDGEPDLLAAGHLDPTSRGTAQRVKIGSGLGRTAYPTPVSAGDFDRDGRTDLAAVGADGKAVWFRATATGIDTTPRPVG